MKTCYPPPVEEEPGFTCLICGGRYHNIEDHECPDPEEWEECPDPDLDD